MLFNSYGFIFYFLIPVVFGFYFLKKSSYRIWFLVAVSVVFYGEWSLKHLAMLLISICANYVFAYYIKEKRTLYLLWFFIFLNLLPLGYFKYSYFLHVSDERHLLPLAISFYTFQQIAFLIDVYRDRIKPEGFREYLVFVLFFPQLVAGPIVHYSELIPQIKSPKWLNFEKSIFGMGLVLFGMGLFKKVVLGDSFGVIADNAFGGNGTLGGYEAWTGVVAYSFQIYFDFGGYGDMAVGLGLLFGVKLPMNFDSPYKAENPVEFWRKWHITLSRFLRDYVYIPLGGNRRGKIKQSINILITMVIGGIWHGAGWGFLAWGTGHGLFLVFSHLFKDKIRFPVFVKTGFTFLTVTLLWVLFRAPDIESAIGYYRVLFDFGSFRFGDFHIYKEGLLEVGFLIVWYFPNSFEISGYKYGKPTDKKWVYTVSGVLFFTALKIMAENPSRAFVYFDF